jgi:hypothetical protein
MGRTSIRQLAIFVTVACTLAAVGSGLICDQHQPVHRGRDSSRVADERRRVVGKDTEGSVEILR